MQKKRVKCKNPDCDNVMDLVGSKLRDISRNEIIMAVIKCKKCKAINLIFKEDLDDFEDLFL